MTLHSSGPFNGVLSPSAEFKRSERRFSQTAITALGRLCEFAELAS